MRIGIISDTHNLLRPEALEKLSDCSLIIHGGDFCTEEVLKRLELMAPVVAARGNCDRETWAERLPHAAEFHIGPHRGLVVHDIQTLPKSHVHRGYRIIVFGHSHAASLRDVNGVLYLNPGGAGPRRFSLPVTMAILELQDDALVPEIVQLT